MASTRELRRRIKSVKNTSQITRAMQMVAATKMRRAQNQAVNSRPYSGNLMESLSRLLPRIQTETHPLLSGNGVSTAGAVILSTDKGLVGALNTNIIRMLSSLHPQGSNKQVDNMDSRLRGNDNVVFYTIGKKGRSFIARTGKDLPAGRQVLKADFENLDTVTFRQAKQIAKLLIDAFMAGEIGEAFLVYPHFVSTLRQEATKVKVLPINISSVIASDSEAISSTDKIASSPSTNAQGPRNDEKGSEFLIEPNADELLDEILTHFVEIRIYQALLETKASEHSARMIAMKNATDNAKELIDDLQLTYNQTRQDAITKEILEIATAAVAME